MPRFSWTQVPWLSTRVPSSSHFQTQVPDTGQALWVGGLFVSDLDEFVEVLLPLVHCQVGDLVLRYSIKVHLEIC